MRYVVIGAGAVGGVIAGLLADAGRDVAVVARGAHGEAIGRDGLLVRLPDRELRVRPAVAPTAGELGLAEGDVLLLAVKSQQTDALLAELGALRLGGERAVERLPLLLAQNGVANEDAALRIAPAVHGVCVNLPGTHLEPGVVQGEGSPVSGVLTLGLATGGSDDVDRAVAADLVAAGFLSEPTDDVMAWKRAKLLRNLGNALDALCGSDFDDAAQAAVADLARRAREEAVRGFAAAGLAVTSDEAYRASTGRFSAVPVGGRERGGGSTWQSVARGQGTVETDWLNGEVVRLGRLHGLPTPVNAMLQREVQRLVADGGEAGSRRPADLAALV